MTLQRTRMREPDATDVTDVRAFSRVGPHVSPHVARLREGAIAHRAVQWLLGAVHVPRVPHQLLAAFEPLRADGACVRPILGVYSPNVRPESADQLELPTALIAAVLRLATTVHADHVYSENRRQLEAEATLTTDIGTGVGVDPLMVVACRALSETFVAARDSTRKRTLTTVCHQMRDKQLTVGELTSTFRTDMIL